MESIAWLALIAMLAVIGFGGWLLRKRWEERRRAAQAREADFVAQLTAARRPAAAAATASAATASAAAFAPAPAAVAVAGAAASPRNDPAAVAQQRLLFEAAAKAAEAGEPVLSIQLYARLLARYPETGFADQVRAAVEVQKKKIKR